MVLFNHRLSRCTNVVSAFDGIASMKRTGESDQNGVWILRNREVTIIPTLDEVWLMSTTSTRVSFIYLLFKFWWAILSLFAGDIFFLVFNYVSLNIDIAQVVISDWTRQHPAKNSDTGNGGPFFSTSHYLQAQLATVFHRARRP